MAIIIMPPVPDKFAAISGESIGAKKPERKTKILRIKTAMALTKTPNILTYFPNLFSLP